MQKKVGHHLEWSHINSKMCYVICEGNRSRIQPVLEDFKYFAHFVTRYCARVGKGTLLPRRQSQQVHLGGYNHLDTGNLLSPWWRPVLASQFQDLQRLLEKGINKLPVVVLVDHSIAGY